MPAIASCDSKRMSTAKVGDLEIQLEELVREHIAAAGGSRGGLAGALCAEERPAPVRRPHDLAMHGP